jgi:quercetin dioxygenase-like cupin family protein
MKKFASSLFASAGISLIAALTPVLAQDVLTVNARTVKLRLENQNVRVLEATLEPGAKEQPHSHPASIIYVIAGGKFRSHAEDGKVSESIFKDGDVIYREPLTHWAENIGDTTIHLIIVELKSPK